MPGTRLPVVGAEAAAARVGLPHLWGDLWEAAQEWRETRRFAGRPEAFCVKPLSYKWPHAHRGDHFVPLSAAEGFLAVSFFASAPALSAPGKPIVAERLPRLRSEQIRPQHASDEGSGVSDRCRPLSGPGTSSPR
jgi:hypothetical protein